MFFWGLFHAFYEYLAILTYPPAGVVWKKGLGGKEAELSHVGANGDIFEGASRNPNTELHS